MHSSTHQSLPPLHPHTPINLQQQQQQQPPPQSQQQHQQPQQQPQQPLPSLSQQQLRQHPYKIHDPVSDQQNTSLEINDNNNNNINTTNLRRGPWSPDEDRKLLDSINIFGPSNWVRISQSLGSRTPKQCRERYHQNLKPSLNRNPISPEEGQLIEELVAKYGKRWAEIARHLNGRSDNAIKNWWNGGANRRRRASTQAILDPPITQHPQHVQPLSDYKQPDQQQQQPKPLQQVQIQQQQQPQQVYHSGPAFNTSIFQSPVQSPGLQQSQLPLPPNSTQAPLIHQSSLAPHAQQQGMLPPLNNGSRSSSINQELFQQQPGVKRLLEEQHYPARRHSAQTILTSTVGSSSPFSSSYSRGGSSRNSSISMEWSNNSLLNTTNNNSTSTSRRSSIAHDYLPHQSKRQNSHSSTYLLSPSFPSHRGSNVGIPSSLTPLTSSSSIQQQYNQQQQQQQQGDKPVFKTSFSFNKNHPNQTNTTTPPNQQQQQQQQQHQESFRLPPPSSIQSNTNFTKNVLINENDLLTSSNETLDQFNHQKKSLENNEEEPKAVMNISNLLG